MLTLWGSLGQVKNKQILSQQLCAKYIGNLLGFMENLDLK